MPQQNPAHLQSSTSAKGEIQMRSTALFLIFLIVPSLVFAADEPPHCTGPLDVIKFKSSSFEVVGDIVSESEDSVVVIPKNGGRIELRRALIGEILYDEQDPPEISTDKVVDEFTHCILRLVESKKPFRVVKTTPETVYVNLGLKDGARPGVELSMYREGEEIIDPETGHTLGREKAFIGIIQIVGVEEGFSTALPVDATAAAFQQGDAGVFLRESPVLAVAGITTLDGKDSPYGALLAEEIISKLKQSSDIKVVERNQLGQVLRELAIQNAILGGAALSDRSMGAENKLIPIELTGSRYNDSPDIALEGMIEKMQMIKGADALIVGTVANVRGRGAVNLRLVDTSTAAVLYSTRKLVRKPEKPIRTAEPKKPVSPDDAASEEVTEQRPASRPTSSKGDLLDRILRAIYQR
jgi:TolB-like protein